MFSAVRCQAGVFKKVARRLNALRERTLALCFGLWRDHAEAKKAREMKKVRDGRTAILQSCRETPWWSYNAPDG